MSQSVYHAQLDPPVGTLYWKSCTTDTYEHTFDSTDDQDNSTYKGYVIKWKVTFHVYVTCQPASDSSFTNDGGKVYIVAVFSGYVRPDWGWTGTPDDLHSFQNTICESTGYLVPVVTALPHTSSGLKDGDSNHYDMDYQQTMSMYKFDDSEYVNFIAQYQETFTRVGYKQSVDCQWGAQINVKRDDTASDHDSSPRVKGLVLLEANSLGKITLNLSSNASWGSESFSSQQETYELDFSADNWVTVADTNSETK